MLSRLSIRAGSSGLLRCTPQIQLMASAPSTSSAVTVDDSKRDLVNFPRPTRLTHPPKVRFGFVPDSWFTYFYPKTGVTGPYSFGVAVGTYLFSKEIIIVESEFINMISLVMVWWFIHRNYGQDLKKFLCKEVDNEAASLDGAQEARRAHLRENIKVVETGIWQHTGLQTLFDIKKENVLLQQEAAYRERLMTAYREVKRRLDYQVEKQNVERRIAQKNLVDWVIRNVLKSITPDQEKNALQKCIADLNGLAVKA